MDEEEKIEIQAIYTKYAKKGLKDCENMTPEEEKKYIKENEPKMIEELEEIRKKYNRTPE